MRVKLREVLEDREGAGMETEYTKEQLLEQARSFELRKCFRLRKATLIDRIVECFCNEDMLRSRLTCLTKEQMDLFRKACNIPQDISINEIMDQLRSLSL